MGIYKTIKLLESTPPGSLVNIIGKVLHVSERQISARSTWKDICVADLSRSRIKVRLWEELARDDITVGQVISIECGEVCHKNGMVMVYANDETANVGPAPQSELCLAIEEKVNKVLNDYHDITLTHIDHVLIVDFFDGRLRNLTRVVTIGDCTVGKVDDAVYKGCIYCKSRIDPNWRRCRNQSCIANPNMGTKKFILMKLALYDSSTPRPLYVSAFSNVLTDVMGISSEDFLEVPAYDRCDTLFARLSDRSLSVTIDVNWKLRSGYPSCTVVDIKDSL